jgi:ubiquinone/menaquinone biosynthesis C-methylase UbiE
VRDYKKELYEQSYFWKSDYLSIPAEAKRVDEIISCVQDDTQTVLDVGCGNGAFVNALYALDADRFEKIVGIDYSSEALKYVKSIKLRASIDNIPVQSKCFDLVSCLEVLEHLSVDEFHNAIAEIQRVSRKYILVSVPNDENLVKHLVLCPKCFCAFNPWFHMRSFSEKNFRNLFNEFRPITIREIGPVRPLYYFNCIFLLLRYGFFKPPPPEYSICPQCGYQKNGKSADKVAGQIQKKSVLSIQNLLALIKPLVKRLIKKEEKRRWLLGLYERKDSRVIKGGLQV